MKAFLLKLIWLYQATLSGFLGRTCRFYPSCSNYAMESIERYGSLKGTTLAIKRVCRCHPFNPGGVDPVPGDVSAGEEK